MMTKRCISCGFKIPKGEEKECYNSKTGEKVYFCRFCYSVFGKFYLQEEIEDDKKTRF